MKRLKPVELFLTLGLTATLAACGTAPTSGGEGGEGGEQSTAAEETLSQGGEGGEGGEAAHSHSSASSDPDVSYMVSLGLMKGHMIVGKELLDEGNYKEAEPHIGHPVEELYGDIESELPNRNVKDFKRTLNQLHDLVKSVPGDPQIAAQYKMAIGDIDTAIAALPSDQLTSPKFVLEVINGLLAVAAEEYEASIADAKFVELVEYQDSRGFVLYSIEQYQTISDQVAAQYPEVDQTIKSTLEDLIKAWPSVNLPDSPIMTPAEVSGLIETIYEESEKL